MSKEAAWTSGGFGLSSAFSRKISHRLGVVGLAFWFCFGGGVGLGWAQTPATNKPATSRGKAAAKAPTKKPLAALRERVLVVGTKESPPFSMKRGDGSWTGISIEMWKRLAERLKLRYRFEETTLKGLIDGLKQGKLDAAVASLTITPEREKVLDFSHPFHSTGLAMAVSSEHAGSLWSSIKKLFSWRFVQFLLALFGVLLLTGALVWFFERKRNSEEFGGTTAQGIGAGFWWSAVSMTTVGYGDKAPRTFWGRAVGLVWIFASLILVSSFTAALTSILTVGKLEGDIKGVQDLHKVRVVTVKNSTSDNFLKARIVKELSHTNTLRSAVQKVVQKEADAVIYDAPILQYQVNTVLKGALRVLPGTFQQQDYGIGLPTKSALREQLNREILRMIYSQEWRDLLRRYLGTSNP